MINLVVFVIGFMLLSPTMEQIRVAKDGSGFVLDRSERPFHPWGFNYGPSNRLLEDDWDTSWPAMVADFHEMKALGANVVRLHLQLGKFMVGPDQPNWKALKHLRRLVKLAERTGLYLDVTGLGCYRPSDVPAWYDALDQPGRWAAQARFWEAVAAQCAPSHAIFCYDLMNEPLVPAGRREPGQWYSGKLFGGYDFLQWISLDQAGRPREELACRWIRELTAAIRKYDRRHLITVGLLPSTAQWGHFSGFVPKAVAPELDFISVHIYPEKGKVPEAVKTLKGFAVGPPLVVEESFPLSCPASDLEEFLLQSRGIACGWLGHYFGQTPEQFEALRRAKQLTIPQALMSDWLELFGKLKPLMTGEPLPAKRKQKK